jgi:hypothetical protein
MPHGGPVEGDAALCSVGGEIEVHHGRALLVLAPDVDMGGLGASMFLHDSS